MVKFTIGIPAYKDKFFRECLKSVIDQDFQDYEVIVLNDQSPYLIKEIVATVDSPRLRYYENAENVGGNNLVDNWNKLLELAQGEYIIIMGDDDLLDVNYLLTFNDLAQKHPDVNVLHCRSKIINDNNEVLRLTPSWPEFEYVYDSVWHRLYEYREQYISDFVYKVKFLKQSGGFFKLPLAWGSDDISFFRSAIDYGVAHTNVPVFSYRRNPYSITSSGNAFVKMEANILYADWLKKFLQQTPPDDQMVTHADLVRNYSRFIHKRKNYVLTLSMAERPLYFLVQWLKCRKQYALSLKQILLGLFNAYKLRKAKKIFG